MFSSNLAQEGGVYSSILFCIVYLGVALCVALVMYLLEAISLYKMAKNMELKNPWISFIPIVSSYAFGRIGQRYVKNDGTPSAKLGKILLILEIILAVLLIAFIAVFCFAIYSVVLYADNTLVGDEAMTMQMLQSVIPAVVLYLAVLGVAIATAIIRYVTMWRVFAIYNYHNATLYLVLSIFFSFLYPIFLFTLRNSQPKFTFEERTNIAQN